MPIGLPLAMLPIAFVLLPWSARAQQDRAVFVARQSADTLAVEVMTRTATTADATLRFRTPRLRVRQVVRLGAGEVVEEITTTVGQGASGDSAVRTSTLRFTRDSVRVQGEGVAERTIAAPAGSLPFLNLSGLSLELILRRARALGGDSATVPLLVTGATRPVVAVVERRGEDSVRITIRGVVLDARADSTGRLLGAAVPAQHLVISREPAESRAAGWTGTVPAPSYAAPSGAPYVAQDVVIDARGGRLAGTLTLPVHAAGVRLPAVVLISGSGAQDRDEGSPALHGWHPFRELADTLSRRGVAVLRLDDRGVGGSAPGRTPATLLDEADDVRDVVTWLRGRDDIDAARIGLLGHSSGGAVASLVAADDPRIRAVVLVAAPASTGRVISAYQIRYLFSEDTTIPPAHRDSLLRVALRQADSALAATPWLRQFAAYDPLPAARRVRAPTLILHGETDRQVPVTDAGRLVTAMRDAGSRRVTLRTFARMNHLLVDDPAGNPMRYETLPDLRVRADLRATVADWLARALGR